MVNQTGPERIVRCFSPNNPHYFMDSAGKLQPIQLDQVENAVSAIGDISLRQKNVVSCGIRKDGSTVKYMGLRPDHNQHTGIEQLEFSIESIEIDEKSQSLDLSKNIALSPVAVNLGGMIIYNNRQVNRQIVPVSSTISGFRLIYRIHTKGLTVKHIPSLNEYWFFSKADNGFRFRLKPPVVLDLETFNPVEGEFEYLPGLVNYDLIQDGDDWLYIKTPGPNWGKFELPAIVGIDVPTAYSETADGRVACTNADWATCRAAATGSNVYDTEANSARSHAVQTGATTINRGFYYFDVSGESGTVSSAFIALYGSLNAQDEVYLMLGTQAAALTTADFDSFTGSYIGLSSSYALSQFNEVALNAQGISDLQTQVGSGTFKICGRVGQDYNNVGWGIKQAGSYFSESSSTTRDPYIEITYGAASGNPWYYYQRNKMRRAA